jgi:hypothetical protein
LNVAVVPVMVTVIGLVVSTVGGLLPPASGWAAKGPENVTIVPAFTLMQAGLYAKVVADTGNVMVTALLPVMSIAVVGSHPFTMVEPPLDVDDVLDPVDEDDDPVLELLVVVELLVVLVVPPVPPAPLLLLLLPHAPHTSAATAHTQVIEVEFFTPSSLLYASEGPMLRGCHGPLKQRRLTRVYWAKMAPCIPLAKCISQKNPKLPALAIVKVAIVPVLVAVIGLVVSTVGGLLPPASG